jgi:hypothetical protein
VTIGRFAFDNPIRTLIALDKEKKRTEVIVQFPVFQLVLCLDAALQEGLLCTPIFPLFHVGDDLGGQASMMIASLSSYHPLSLYIKKKHVRVCTTVPMTGLMHKKTLHVLEIPISLLRLYETVYNPLLQDGTELSGVGKPAVYANHSHGCE